MKLRPEAKWRALSYLGAAIGIGTADYVYHLDWKFKVILLVTYTLVFVGATMENSK